MKQAFDKDSPLLSRTIPIPQAAIKGQLARILDSRRFSGLERLRSLLDFIVTQYLEGKESSLKETIIGTEVFGKPVGYDTQTVSIVRTTAQRLRTELTAYYEVEGANDPIIITLPKGRYRPEFAIRTVDETVENVAPAAVMNSPTDSRWSRKNCGIIFCFVAIVGLISALLYLRHGGDSPRTSSALPIGRLFAQATAEGKTPIRLNVGHQIGWLLVAPNGNVLYAIELLGRSVTRIGAKDLKIESRFQLPHPARGAVISQNGKRLYIGSPDGAVMIVDTERGSVERILTGAPVYDVAVTPDESKVFLAMGSGGLKRVVTTSKAKSTLSEFACPMFLNMDVAGRNLFVGYQCGGPGGRSGHDVVEIYDTSSEQRLGVIHDLPMVGGEPIVSPRGDMILLDAADACVTKTYDHIGCPEIPGHVFHLIRLADRTLVKSFVRPKDMYGAVFTPDGGRLVFGGDSLTVMDWAKQTITEVTPVQNGPFSRIAFTPKGDRLFAASGDGGTELMVLDTEKRECSPSLPGLANWYSGDGTLDDSIGVSSLTAVGTVTFAPGLIGQAFQFGSRYAALRAGGAAACPSCYRAWTESFFVKFRSIDGEMTLLERDSRSDRWYHRIFKASDNRIVFEGNAPGGSLISGSAPALAEKWYHVAIVADDARRFLYVDGVLQGQMDLGKSSDAPGTPKGMVLFGVDRNNRTPLNGLIDEITWHERALDGKEVMSLSQSRSRSACRP
jgi:Concanavalin A-like lectin/glucanases superfamily